jgi:transcriptional regulator with XRE-family HTH domain
MSKKQYTDVTEMVRDIHPDDKFSEELSSRIKSRKIIKQLLVLRAKEGLSQKDVAERMQCTQSKLSKLENGSDDTLRLGDLKKYGKAVNREFFIDIVPDNLCATDKVKAHVFEIRKLMGDLVNIASDASDESISQGVANFANELMLNTIMTLKVTAQSLPRKEDGTPYFDIKFSSPNESADTSDSSDEESELISQ